MKRKICAVMIGIMAMSMVACGENTSVSIDPVSQKVINDINSLGEITIEDESDILKITEIYLTLTDDQKAQVTNYITLLEAQEKLEEIKNQVSEATVVGRNYYSLITMAISNLKGALKNPSSLEIYGIIINSAELYDSESKVTEMSQKSAVIVTIGYTATNSYGSAMDGYYVYQWGTIDATVHGYIGKTDHPYTYREREKIILGNSNVDVPYEIEGIFKYSDPDRLERSANLSYDAYAEYDRTYKDNEGELHYWDDMSRIYTFPIDLDDFVKQGNSLK